MRSFLGLALKIAVSASLLYFALARVNLSVVWQRLSEIQFVWLLPAILILAAQVIIVALRWRRIVLACEPSSSFSLSQSFRYSLIGTFFNQTLPSTIGGDAVRVWLLARDGTGWKIATYSVLIDRFAGVIALALIVVCCLPWSFALIGDPTGRLTLLAVGIGSVFAGLCFMALGFLRWPWLERWWLTGHLVSAARITRQIATSPAALGPIGAYSLFNHILSVTAAWCLAKSAGISLEWVQALLLVPPVFMIATIPLSIAGWGVRESSMIIAFSYAGLPESDGLIVSVLYGAATFAVGILGGITWVLSGGSRKIMPSTEPSQKD